MKARFQRDAAVAKVAREVLHISKLESQRSDQLDFHERAVWALREALEAAFDAGVAAAQAEAKEASRTVVRGDGTKVKVFIPGDEE